LLENQRSGTVELLPPVALSNTQCLLRSRRTNTIPLQPEHRSNMPQVPDVGAIVEQVKARIKQIEGELARHERLSDELTRLRDALGRLEGAGRARVSRVRRGRPPATRAAEPNRTARAPKRTSAPGRAPRGQNKAKVLEALKSGPMTASEISKATGIATGTISTLLTKLSKTGEVAKAERGYRLPD
jgi:predicted Rossmann fold nucleotide-binding protein DprA/Smf involved in DNA uptake